MANVNVLVNNLIMLYSELRTRANHIKADTHLSDEGKQDAWTKYIEPRAEALQIICERVEEMTAMKAKQVESMEQAVMDPTTIADVQRIAAELEAARLMGRGPLDMHTTMQAVEQAATGKAPGAVIIVAEAVARDVVKAKAVTDKLEQINPDYKQAKREQTLLLTAVNNVVKKWEQAINALLQSYATPDSKPAETIVDVRKVTGDEGVEVAGVLGLPLSMRRA